MLAVAAAAASDPALPYIGDAHAQSAPDPAVLPLFPTDSAIDGGPAGFDELDGAYFVDTFVMNGTRYVIATSLDDNGVQLIRINEDATMSPAGSATDGVGGFTHLGRPYAVKAFSINGTQFAIATSPSDRGVQLIRIHENGTLSPASSAQFGGGFWLWTPRGVDVFGTDDGARALVGNYYGVQLIDIHENGTMSPGYLAWSGRGNFTQEIGPAYHVRTFTLNGSQYAVSTAREDNAVNLIKIHENGTMTSAGTAVNDEDGYDALGGANDIDVFVRDGATYAVATGYNSHGVQIIRIHENGTMSNASSAKFIHYTAGYRAITFPLFIDAFAIGGETYTVSTIAYGGAVQMIHIDDEGNPSHAGWVRKERDQRPNTYNDLGRTRGIAAFVLGSDTYAAVASYDDDAVSLVRIHGNGTLVPGVSVSDYTGGFEELTRSASAAVAEVANRTYAAVAAEYDDGVQLIRIDDDGILHAADSASDGAGGYDALDGAKAVDTFAIGNDTYAIVASRFDDGVQLIRIHGNGTLAPWGSAFNGTASATGTFDMLVEPVAVDAFVAGGDTYAMVAAKDGVQAIYIDEDGAMSPAGSLGAFSGGSIASGLDVLAGPAHGIDVFGMGNGTYAIVASGRVAPQPASQSGLQLVNITVSASGTLGLAPAGSVAPVVNSTLLGHPRGVDTLTIGNDTYAIAATWYAWGAQLIRIHENGTLAPGASAVNGTVTATGTFDVLTHPSGVDTFAIGNDTYAVVPARFGAQVIRIHENATMSYAGTAVDQSPSSAHPRYPRFDTLSWGEGAAAFASGGATYAIVASNIDDGVQLIRMTEPAEPRALSVEAYELNPRSRAISAAAPVNLVVNFNTKVYFDGRPELLLNTGGTASYWSGNKSSVVVFVYWVGPGEQVPLLDAVELRGDGITDSTGAPVSRDLPAPGSGHALSDRWKFEIDAILPRILSVSSLNESRTYGAGSVIHIVVEFSEPLDRVYGSPRLALETGDTDRDARFVSFDMENATFHYVVQDGDYAESLDYTNKSALRLKYNEFILDAIGNNANLTLPEPGSPESLNSSGIKIDAKTIPPSAQGASSPNASRTYGLDQRIAVDVEFNGTVHVEGSPYLDLNASDAARAVYAGGSGSETLRFVYTVGAGDWAGDLGYAGTGALKLGPGGSIRGADTRNAVLALPEPGQNGSLSASADIAIDAAARPPATSAQGASSPNASRTYGIGEQITIDVEFNGTVVVAGAPYLDLNASDAARAVYAEGNGSETLRFVYTVGAGDRTDDLGYAGTGALRLGPGGSIAGTDDRGGGLWVYVDPAGEVNGTVRRVADLNASLALPDPGPLSASGKIAIDGVAPRVLSVSTPNASATYGENARINIEVRFSERVVVSGQPEIVLGTVPARTADYATGSDTEALLFVYAVQDGDSAPDGLDYRGIGALQLGGASGAIRDRAGNDANRTLPAHGTGGSLVDSARIIVATAGPPAPGVESVSSPGGNATYKAGDVVRIAVLFDAAVTVSGTPMLALDIGGSGSADDRSASYESGDGTNTLEFAYTVQAGDEAGDLDYADSTALRLNGGTISATAAGGGAAASLVLPETGSPKSLAGSGRIVIDGVAPFVRSVSSPTADGTYGAGDSIRIAVEFSESVTAAGTPVLALSTTPARSASYVDGTDGDAELEFAYAVQRGDMADPLAYAGPNALSLAGGSIADIAGNPAVLVLPAPGSDGSLRAGIVVAAADGTDGTDGTGGTGVPGNVTDGTGGTGVPGNVTDGTGGPGGPDGNVTVRLVVEPGGPTGAINVTDRGDAARILLDIGGLAGNGTADAGTAAFAGGLAVNASFATVSIPPGTTARQVPSDGILVLYATNRTYSDRTVQDALSYPGSGPVAVQGIVEIGSVNSTITFDMPVRISLDGQAGGRAFYINATSGAVTAIDRACTADDAEWVHRQLAGSGECQLDSGGGDKVIYTYHLTRFGTVAASEPGAPPPPVTRECRLDLATTSLAVDATPGNKSKAARQGLDNLGSLRFASVALDATPWYIDPPPSFSTTSVLPGPEYSSLPAALTLVGEDGEGGAFSALADGNGGGGGGADVARGLDGGERRHVWFQIDLSAYDAVNGSKLAQRVTYTAECAAVSP